MSRSNTISILTTDTNMEKSAHINSAAVNGSTPSSQSSRGVSPNPNGNINGQGRGQQGQGQFRPGPLRKTTTRSFQEESSTKPVDLEHHSKLPYFLRTSGSITPRMLIPIAFVAAWSTMITCICVWVYPLVVNNLLLTVLGFVVGLGISFRTSSAYERYVDGRKYWMQLSQASRDLARHIWIHVQERDPAVDPALAKSDLLDKIAALNLITAFAEALKHRLRFEPYTDYDDLSGLVSHLDTFAGSATAAQHADGNETANESSFSKHSKKSKLKYAGEWLGLTFAESNPRKLIKRSTRQLGNLPLEILTYLSSYHDSLIYSNMPDGNGGSRSRIDPTYQGSIAANIASMNEVLAGTERVLNTPLPIAYSIAISQITWVYVLVLPFQLFDSLKWITIPGSMVAAYIILGIAAIGREIENPFGLDANDLPLDAFCLQIAREIDVIRSRAKLSLYSNNHSSSSSSSTLSAADAGRSGFASGAGPFVDQVLRKEDNRLLFGRSWNEWENKDIGDIRRSLAVKAQEVQLPKPSKAESKWRRGWAPQGEP